METPKEYHYTYYSYEEWGRGYFGSRTCKCLPEKDVKYFGSFYDKTFKPTQKIILKSDYATRVEAITDEIILHDYYDVANNPHFANQAKQTCTKFSIYGTSHSKETRRKISISNTGKSRSKETREKIREANKGENSPKYGKSPSQETKRKQREVMIGRKWWNDGCGNNKFCKECPGEGWVQGRSEEIIINQREIFKGENNHNYGKKWWNDGEENIKMSVECPGEDWVPGRGKWWNDGCGNSKRSIKCPGEGWVPGRDEEVKRKQSETLTGKPNSNRGRKWWNDGCGNNKRSVECPGEGWVPGLMRKNHYENWNRGT
jgi:hypothetical protein